MNSKNEKKDILLQMVEIDHQKFAVELLNGNANVNLTQMAKPFGRSKRPVDWLKTNEAKSYLEMLSVVKKITTADLVSVKQGGQNQGTWCTDYRIAMRFAQWLDPRFALMVDELLVRLLTGQAVVLESRHGVMPIYFNNEKIYSYRDALEAFGRKRNGNVSRRKNKHREHFRTLFGRNFITEKYLDLMAGYYNWKNAQLSLELNFGGLAQ